MWLYHSDWYTINPGIVINTEGPGGGRVRAYVSLGSQEGVCITANVIQPGSGVEDEESTGAQKLAVFFF